MKTIQLPYTKPLTKKTQSFPQFKFQDHLLKLLKLEVFTKSKQPTDELEIDFILACAAVCRYLLIGLMVLLMSQ